MRADEFGAIPRETSRETWREISNDGTAANMRERVYLAVVYHPDRTAAEICRGAGIDGGWRRFVELRRAGKIRPSGTRRCAISGRPAMTWEAGKEGGP